MKRRLILFFLLGTALISTAAAQTLTQQDVIKLLELKIPEQTIIEKVNSSGTSFVLGVGDIERLKKAGATDALIAAMQSTASVPAAGNPASEITDLVLIVDYSGSMNAKMKDGAAKVASAKRCVGDLIDKLPNDLNVGLIVYGTHKQRGCQDIDIVQPLGPTDKNALKTKINSFNATGMTPIAASLLKAGDELKKAKGGSAIVLVTDGAETCHGDPVAVSAKLAAEFGVKFGLNVIGFGIEPQEKAQLADIAAKGHGKLLTVENASELASALQRVAPEKTAPTPVATPTPTPKPTPKPTPTPTPRETKQYEAGGEAVKAGAWFNDAPTIKAGEFKGTLAMMQACYYRISVRKGQELRAVAIVHKTPYRAGLYGIHQSFGITIYNSALKIVASEKPVVDGNPEEPVTFRASWTAESDDVAYVCIAASDNFDSYGSPADPLHESSNEAKIAPSSYTLRLRLEGEPAEGEPAIAAPIKSVQRAGGSGFNSAAELTAPISAISDLKLGETTFYKVAVKKGDAVQVLSAFQKPWYEAEHADIETTYTLTVYDDDQVQVSQNKMVVKKNPPEAQSTSVEWPATISGNVYVSVSAKHTGLYGISPAKFEPKPGPLIVQVTTQGGSSETGVESGKASEGEKPPEAEKKIEGENPSATPTATPTPRDPFAGAESSPGL